MSELLVKSESLAAVADSIRAKTGSIEELVFPDGFVEAVEGMSTGGDTEGSSQKTFDIYVDENDFEIPPGKGYYSWHSPQQSEFWSGNIKSLTIKCAVANVKTGEQEEIVYKYKEGDVQVYLNDGTGGLVIPGESLGFRIYFFPKEYDPVLETILGAGCTIESLYASTYKPLYVHIYKECEPLGDMILDLKSQGKTLYGIFADTYIENPPLFDTSFALDASCMFWGCPNIKTIPLYNTKNVTTMNEMFYNSNKLETIPLLDTSSVTSMYRTFYNCKSLMKIPALDFRNLTLADAIFLSCSNLTECYIRNIKISLQVGSGSSWGHLLTVDSLIHLIKECRDTGSMKTLTIGTTNLEKLANTYVKIVDVTDEMRAEDDLIDEKLPFVVCESTDEGAMLITDYVLEKNWQLK